MNFAENCCLEKVEKSGKEKVKYSKWENQFYPQSMWKEIR